MHELRNGYEPDYEECDCADARGAVTKTDLVSNNEGVPESGSTIVRNIGGVIFVSNIQK